MTLKRSGPIARRTPLRRKAWLRSSTWQRTSTVRRDSPTLRGAKLEVRQRSGGRCEARIDGVCKGTGHHAHHVILRARGGPDTADNLLWVCWACHRWIHDHVAESTLRGLISSLTISTRRPGER